MMKDKLLAILITIFGGSAAVVLFCLSLAFSLLGLFIHVWTIFIAYNWSGGFGFTAIITAAFPVIAQIYWIVRLWIVTGVFLTPLTIACLVYVGIFATPFIIVAAGYGISQFISKDK